MKQLFRGITLAGPVGDRGVGDVHHVEIVLRDSRCLRITADVPDNVLRRLMRVGGAFVIAPGSNARVHLARGVTDMRKGITGLAAKAREEFRQNASSGALFAFGGRRGDRIKLLHWDGQGFLALLQGARKRLLSVAFAG